MTSRGSTIPSYYESYDADREDRHTPNPYYGQPHAYGQAQQPHAQETPGSAAGADRDSFGFLDAHQKDFRDSVSSYSAAPVASQRTTALYDQNRPLPLSPGESSLQPPSPRNHIPSVYQDQLSPRNIASVYHDNRYTRYGGDDMELMPRHDPDNHVRWRDPSRSSSSFVDMSDDRDTIYPPNGNHRYSSSTNIPLVDDKSEGEDGKPPKRMPSIMRDPNVQKQIQARKNHRPYFIWAVSLVQLIVFIYEIVHNAQLTGSPIEIHPVFNPLIGPAQETTINVGARFDPCMRVVSEIANLAFPCLNDTGNPPTTTCSIEEICGMGGFHGGKPNQWWRFIVPMFLHGGVLHIGFNLLFQLRQGADLERDIGAWRIAIVYFASGIFGFVLGGNFAGAALASTGASGALFGLIALILLDLIHNWRIIEKPVRQLLLLLFQIVISFALGLLPLLDNFSHIGGFAMGLLSGLVFAPVIHFSVNHRRVIWALRIVALPIAVVLFVVLIRNFYTDDPQNSCKACVYLSCIPIALTNYCQGLGVQTTTINLPASGGAPA